MINGDDWATGQIRVVHVRVDAQHFEQGVMKIARHEGLSLRDFAQAVGTADEAAAFDAAAADEDAHSVAPVIAAGSALAAGGAAVAAVVHAGCAAEFASKDHR